MARFSKTVDQVDLQQQYNGMVLKKNIFLSMTFVLLLFLIVFSICVGSSDIAMKDVINAIFQPISGQMTKAEMTKYNIIHLLRLPRVLLAIFTGAGLSMCGAVMQGITRNPLASPYTLGISNAAAFGAALSIMFVGKEILGGQVVCAFLMAMVCSLLVYGVSAAKGMKTTTIILMGIALTYLFNSLTATIQYFANEQQLENIIRWTFGSVNGATWNQVTIVGVALILVLPIFFFYANSLNAMATSSDEVPKSLGIDVKRVRVVTGLACVMLTAIIISFTGVIGFVGIVGPHIARLIVGSNYKFLLPCSAIFGGILLLCADTIGRTAFGPINIPVGIVVAYIGVPIFVHLIITDKKGGLL